MVSYVLDENLIDFGSALEEQDYDRCLAALPDFTVQQRLLHIFWTGLVKTNS